MKICLISDSHGSKRRLSELLESQKFDFVFFLGDGIRDIEDYDDPTIKKVCGNCDFFSQEATTQTFNIEENKFMITHGHEYKAKFTKLLMAKYAKSQNCDIVCYGHTHKQQKEVIDGVLLVNPGAFKNHEYAVLNVNGKNIDVEFFKD